MYHKGIVMEIKKEYCLVLDNEGMIVRLYLKDGLEVGQKIYYLEEDIYEEQKDMNAGWIYSKAFKKVVVSCLAVLLLTFSFVLFKPVDAYATVSLDGDKSVQVTLDKNLKIKEAHSFDESISEQNLDALIHLSLKDLKDLYDGDDFILIGYTLHTYDLGEDKQLKDLLMDIFGDKKIEIFDGTSTDLKYALQAQKNLGLYLIDQYDEDDFEEWLDDYDVEDMEELLESHPELANNQKFLEELKEKEFDEDDDDDDDDDEEEDDDDEDDDEDDDD